MGPRSTAWHVIDWGMDQSVVSLGDMVEGMNSLNFTFYHLWSWNLYLVDPSGDGIQCDADWGSDMPSW